MNLKLRQPGYLLFLSYTNNILYSVGISIKIITVLFRFPS